MVEPFTRDAEVSSVNNAAVSAVRCRAGRSIFERLKSRECVLIASKSGSEATSLLFMSQEPGPTIKQMHSANPSGVPGGDCHGDLGE